MKTELLRILRESDGYVSGQQLCRHFGVSRTAVWKTVCRLKAEGYEIQAVRNRGYRICEAPDLMTAEEVESRLHTRTLGRNCIYLNRVDSTNNYAKRIAEEGAKEGTLVIAEEQTGGKGRRGRGWIAPRNVNVMMTLLLRPRIQPRNASMLTLLMAMAAVRAIREVTGFQAGIKWPNDVVAGGRKVCGILTEMSSEPDYINYVVIGIGMNVNQKDFPQEIAGTAGSLSMVLGRDISRAELTARVMEALEELYEIFLETEDMSKLCREYNSVCLNIGHPIKVLEPKNEYSGVTDGINEKGELVVKKDDGDIVCVYAGEVSVRGLYGYV